MNTLRILFSAIFVHCLLFLHGNASEAGSCFSSSFSRAIGYVLQGFLLGEIKVTTVMECKRRCVISANCLSLNILTNSDGSFICQLNSDVKENGVKEQFVQHGSGEYYGLKKKNICKNNGKTCNIDPTWFAFNQSYFQFVGTPISFEEARKVCLEKKGDLASTASEEEQNFLYKTFVDGNSEAGQRVWVGLNDIAEEGVFVWTDGSPNSYSKFMDGEPDNYGNNEHCVVMPVDINGDYRDNPCDATFTFICETTYQSL